MPVRACGFESHTQYQYYANVVELAYTLDLGSSAVRRKSSSLFVRTIGPIAQLVRAPAS